jgi:hypothetical protein
MRAAPISPSSRPNWLRVNRPGVPDADRRAKLLICLGVKGSLLDAYSHLMLIYHGGARHLPFFMVTPSPVLPG